MKYKEKFTRNFHMKRNIFFQICVLQNMSKGISFTLGNYFNPLKIGVISQKNLFSTLFINSSICSLPCNLPSYLWTSRGLSLQRFNTVFISPCSKLQLVGFPYCSEKIYIFCNSKTSKQLGGSCVAITTNSRIISAKLNGNIS